MLRDWVIESKLAPPVTRHALVERERLDSSLKQALERRVAVVHAPAGFGKTSLLACWREKLMARGVPVGWLSLDDNDWDLVQFLNYLVEAMRSGGLLSGPEVLPGPGGVSAMPAEAQAGAVLTEVARSASQGVLILDDFHRAESAENCRTVDQLIVRLASTVHIVVSSREYPKALSLADLRVRGELVEIDHAALQFREPEIRAWMGSMIDDPVPEDWAQQLHERTEGWPIALNTVRRWLREGTPPGETLEQLSGRSSDLSDYFLEQVFETLDRKRQLFLLKTSILERVNGDLANLLCESNDAWQTLEDLERRDLFVQSLDRERVWYRYHRLFAEFLQERMRRRFDGLQVSLHRVATGWFQQQGFITEAIQHALDSRDSETVANLFESLGGWHHALKGHYAVLARGIAIVGDETLERYPRLWLGKIFLTVRSGETERAQAMLDRLSAAKATKWADDPEIGSELLIMRSLVNRYADADITSSELDQLERLEASFLPSNDLMHAVRCNLLCMMHAQRGGFDACMTAGDKAIRHFRAMGSVFGETFIYFHEGYACMEQGRLRDAEALYGVGRDLALEHFGEGSDLAAIAGAFLAETAYEQNNVAEAKRLLDGALPHIERFDAWLEVYVAAYTTAMKLARCSPGEQSSIDFRNRARTIAARRGLTRLCTIVDLQEQELAYLAEAQVTAERQVENLEKLTEGAAGHLALRRLRVSVLARSYLRIGDTERARALLDRECRRCRQRGLMRSYVSFLILLAVVWWREGKQDAAVAAFETALSPSLFEGIKRPFIDEGEALARMIDDQTDASEGRRGNRLRDRFLAEVCMAIEGGWRAPHAGGDSLTAREREILRYLVQGRSNREIAEAVAVSVNTVKFHLKNIFDKFGVTNRKDAVMESIRQSQMRAL